MERNLHGCIAEHGPDNKGVFNCSVERHPVNRWDYPNFTYHEMACKGCDANCSLFDANYMHPTFMRSLQRLRDVCRFPFSVSSGFRCVGHNADEGGRKRSPHLVGRAVDIRVRGKQAFDLIRVAMDSASFVAQGLLPFNGIGISQKKKGRFVHLDTMVSSDWKRKVLRPTVWTY